MRRRAAEAVKRGARKRKAFSQRRAKGKFGPANFIPYRRLGTAEFGSANSRYYTKQSDLGPARPELFLPLNPESMRTAAATDRRLRSAQRSADLDLPTTPLRSICKHKLRRPAASPTSSPLPPKKLRRLAHHRINRPAASPASMQDS